MDFSCRFLTECVNLFEWIIDGTVQAFMKDNINNGTVGEEYFCN
jgi:hypothetical protein